MREIRQQEQSGKACCLKRKENSKSTNFCLHLHWFRHNSGSWFSKAVKGYGRRGYLVVVYKEVSPDEGFVITTYFIRRLKRRAIVWQP
ncbi:MAG: hypothetical protein LKKZDAJK_001105 [Candidatus Fervidibacter sp.]